MFTLSGLFGGSSVPVARKTYLTPPTTRFRPRVEGLEERTVPSAVAAAPQVAAQLAPVVPGAVQQAAPILNIDVSNIRVDPANANQLLADITANGVTQTVPLNLTVTNPGAGATPILDLHLDPIHLDLLGLTVDTSPICLSITAQSGPGDLLGNLLGGLLGGLDTSATPLSLTDVLGSLDTAQVTSLLDGVLQPALNAGLDQLFMPSSVNSAAVTPGTGTTTSILHLSLGPVDLNLLGLDIHLDNCSGGPVTVDIGAQSGPGKLLGNLLGGLAHSLDHAPAGALAAHLNTIGRTIGRLV